MTLTHIATFESKTAGPITVERGWDERTQQDLYDGAHHPGILRTLGGKDLKRFSEERFPEWTQEGGGKYLYTARDADRNLAATFWVGGKRFPYEHFPNAETTAAYTAAWRTAYNRPGVEGGTFEGEGIGKRIALAGLADVVWLTRNGGPVGLPPLLESGGWLDTGVENLDAQNLYHRLGNSDRDQAPIGFVDQGVYHPPLESGKPQEESRVGMAIDPATLEQVISLADRLIHFV